MLIKNMWLLVVFKDLVPPRKSTSFPPLIYIFTFFIIFLTQLKLSTPLKVASVIDLKRIVTKISFTFLHSIEV